jgi:parallel beta-helix repeat protein
MIYSGISAGWSWGYGKSGCHHNVIEHNHIHHLGFGVLSELSSIYTLGISPGTRIRYNLCHDALDYRYGTWVMGLDEGTSYVLVENNIGYNHRHGIGLHYGRENEVRNNIIAFCQGDHVGIGRIEEHLAMNFHHNILVALDAPLVGGNFGRTKVQSDYNVYWDLAVRDEVELDGLLLSEWQEEKGLDRNSVVADPLFVDAEHYDFRLRPDSPALRIGFKPFDLSESGLYGEAEWVQLPRKIKRAPFTFERISTAGETVEDDFEATEVGQLARFAHTSGEGKGASIRVTDETAASGKHSVKFTDAPDIGPSWQPHMYYPVRFSRGAVKVSFDIRVEKGAKVVVQLRDWPAGANFSTGPTLMFVDGQLLANEQAVTDIPFATWTHVEIECPLGRAPGRTYSLMVAPAGGKTVKVQGIPAGAETFRHLTWLGFISEATDTAVFYIDNVKIGLEK